MLPLVAPGLVANPRVRVHLRLNEFIFALTFLGTIRKSTLPIYVTYFSTAAATVDWGSIMASSTLFNAPGPVPSSSSFRAA